MHPVRLRCEYLERPLGIDCRRPRLSWALSSETPGQSQSAYRLLVASSEAGLAAGQADLWDSGKVPSAQTLHVHFAGSPLRNLEFKLEPVAGYAGFMGLEYVRTFAQAVLQDTPPPISGEDAVAVLKVVEAIYQAAAEKRWVKVRR